MPQRCSVSNNESKQTAPYGEVHCYGLAVGTPWIIVRGARTTEAADMCEVGGVMELDLMYFHARNG